MASASRLRRRAALAVLMLAGLAFAGCSVSSQPGESQDASASPATPEAGTIAVATYDYYFQPNNIVIPAGQEITIVVRNEGRAAHNLLIVGGDAQGRTFKSDTVRAGREDRLTVMFDSPGTYRFVCDFHPNMTGQITVGLAAS